MGLRAIEQKIESLFEGVFGRAFRTNVQPVEIARKLAKEMDDHRTVSVSRVYAPNDYTVYLSTADREQFSGYENSLLSELEEYLSEHATRESYALLTPVRVQLETDDDLALGEFGIAARMVQPRRGHREEPEPRAEPAATMIHPPPQEPEGGPGEAEPVIAVLSWGGHSHRVESPRAVLGRSRDSDVQIDDVNVSRRHAELRRESDGFWIVDLDSTNGVEVDGRRVKRAKLEPGGSFTVGSTVVTFATEPP
ncbi:MAG TPA: DUF3662 and FHA domain-containing protein [Gaiellaceae bacterium]|nr:DUF3662 and FHA domain-containing protein [Gaiellaceae bacterium]